LITIIVNSLDVLWASLIPIFLLGVGPGLGVGAGHEIGPKHSLHELLHALVTEGELRFHLLAKKVQNFITKTQTSFIYLRVHPSATSPTVGIKMKKKGKLAPPAKSASFQKRLA